MARPNIIPETSDMTISKAELLDLSSEEKVPWVKIGDVYASLTMTGDMSWNLIVREEHKSGRRKFAILTGRHGDWGQVVDVKTGQFQGIADDRHNGEDAGMCKTLRAQLGGLDIEAIDVGKPPYDTADALRKLVTQKLGAGATVILAWCYSICCMRELPDTFMARAPVKVKLSHMDLAKQMPVKNLVPSDFFWVPRA
jgi:hypothetical protein